MYKPQIIQYKSEREKQNEWDMKNVCMHVFLVVNIVINKKLPQVSELMLFL